MPPEITELLVSRLKVINSRSSPFTVWVEPWGEDFTLLPEEDLTVFAKSPAKEPCFALVQLESGVQVYVEGQDIVDFSVIQDGIELECGHNRNQGSANA
jgi:hypothetical protein